MSARIARGGGGSRGRARTQSKPRAAPRRPKRAGVMQQIGIAPETVRTLGLFALLGTALAAAIATITWLRLPQQAGTWFGERVGDAGFAVKRIEPRGLNRLNPMQVYWTASDQLDRGMPLVDLEGTRQRLLRFGWVADARVSRRLPDTLVIDIVERRPAAIWQNERRLVLIDREGVVLEPVRLDAMPDLPLVIGAGANRETGALSRLLDAAPHLRPQTEGASWIGGRRWDLRFQSGEVLALPEGEEAARRAILAFARMDQQTQLLGRGFARFDMRIPGRFIVRVTRQPGMTVPALEPEPEAPTAPADLRTTI